jgi:hypothetical protein
MRKIQIGLGLSPKASAVLFALRLRAGAIARLWTGSALFCVHLLSRWTLVALGWLAGTSIGALLMLGDNVLARMLVVDFPLAPKIAVVVGACSAAVCALCLARLGSLARQKAAKAKAAGSPWGRRDPELWAAAAMEAFMDVKGWYPGAGASDRIEAACLDLGRAPSVPARNCFARIAKAAPVNLLSAIAPLGFWPLGMFALAAVAVLAPIVFLRRVFRERAASRAAAAGMGAGQAGSGQAIQAKAKAKAKKPTRWGRALQRLAEEGGAAMASRERELLAQEAQKAMKTGELDAHATEAGLAEPAQHGGVAGGRRL